MLVKMTVEQCQDFARQAVRAELTPLSPWPSELDDQLALGARLEGECWIFVGARRAPSWTAKMVGTYGRRLTAPPPSLNR